MELTRNEDSSKLGFSRNGRRIVEINRNGPADRNGKMMIGDEIVAINHKEVDNVGEISSLLRNSKPSVIITLSRYGRH